MVLEEVLITGKKFYYPQKILSDSNALFSWIMAVSEEQRILAILSEAVNSISNRPNNNNNNSRPNNNNNNIKRSRGNSRSSEESVISFESREYDSGFDFTIDSLDYDRKKFIR